MSSRSTFRNMMVVQTSDIEKKARVLHFPNYQRLLVFFILSFFEKKFLIWSMRKPRVINIILSSSVISLLWTRRCECESMLLPLCSECFTLSCIFVSSSSNCHSLSNSSVCFSDFAVIISTVNIAIFKA